MDTDNASLIEKPPGRHDSVSSGVKAVTPHLSVPGKSAPIAVRNLNNDAIKNCKYRERL